MNSRKKVIVRGDVTFLDQICASHFSFTHGDGWTTGGAPFRVERDANERYSCKQVLIKKSGLASQEKIKK